MMVDPANYQGREQALVKHTFLDRYLINQLMKVGRFGKFAYVDLFAGPWESRAPDYSDTSFGIALRRMAEAKASLAKVGKQVELTAHLVEKENFEELQHAASLFSDVKITCYPGRAEDHASAIARSIPRSAFRFVAIDPKGLPDLRHFAELISAPNTEVLVNFMLDFARRFVATERMPALIDWLGTVAPGPDWQATINKLPTGDREDYITDMARGALLKMGAYDFAPAITVDKVVSNRALYKLIFLTRHPLGLRVFRDAQVAALEVQSNQRSKVQAERRQARTGQGDLLAAAGIADPGERSAQILRKGRREAEERLLSLVDGAPPGGILWGALWAVILDEIVVTYSHVSAAVARWHREGRLQIRGLAPSARVPKDEHYISR